MPNGPWVTGAATGIGRSLAESMALQGLNVVLVSLPDKHLEKAEAELKAAYPDLEFRAVGAVFDHKTDYMPQIIEATRDIDVQVVWNNAGYIVTGFFDHTTLDAQLANLECNATACVKVTIISCRSYSARGRKAHSFSLPLYLVISRTLSASYTAQLNPLSHSSLVALL